jgi:hypothetical protein
MKWRAILFWAAAAAAFGQGCPEMAPAGSFKHRELGEINVYKSGAAVLFASMMHVNTDGAPDSYHPDDTGLTHICNGLGIVNATGACEWKANCLADYRAAKSNGFAGSPRLCFFAIATENGKPLVQREGDPRPGYYVTTTALQHRGADPKTQRAYLDSNEIPYIVIPTAWQRKAYLGIKLGDVAALLRKSNGKMEYAVAGDLGPAAGEASIAAHRALGNEPLVLKGGVRRALRGIGGRDVVYAIFPGSRARLANYSAEAIRAEGRRLVESFGGEERLRECAQAAR